MFKKLIKKWASDIVLDALLVYATKQLPEDDSTAAYDRWATIIDFLQTMKEKGLPL